MATITAGTEEELLATSGTIDSSKGVHIGLCANKITMDLVRHPCDNNQNGWPAVHAGKPWGLELLFGPPSTLIRATANYNEKLVASTRRQTWRDDIGLGRAASKCAV